MDEFAGISNTQVTLYDPNDIEVVNGPRKHGFLYFEETCETTRILQVENTLFRFPMVLLAIASPAFPYPVNPMTMGAAAEGVTEKSPIVIAGDHSLHWEGLVAWLTHVKVTLCMEDWVGVLVLSHKYAIDKGVEHARHHLLEANLDPSYKLRLAWEFDLTELIPGCVRLLLKLPFLTLKAYDLMDLEPELAAVINIFREKIMHHRLTLVCHLEPLRHIDQCFRAGCCGQHWPIAYLSCTRQFANPENPMDGLTILKLLEVEPIPDINTHCFRNTIEFIRNRRVFDKEDRYREDAVVEVMAAMARAGRPISRLRLYNSQS